MDTQTHENSYCKHKYEQIFCGLKFIWLPGSKINPVCWDDHLDA